MSCPKCGHSHAIVVAEGGLGEELRRVGLECAACHFFVAADPRTGVVNHPVRTIRAAVLGMPGTCGAVYIDAGGKLCIQQNCNDGELADLFERAARDVRGDDGVRR